MDLSRRSPSSNSVSSVQDHTSSTTRGSSFQPDTDTYSVQGKRIKEEILTRACDMLENGHAKGAIMSLITTTEICEDLLIQMETTSKKFKKNPATKTRAIPTEIGANISRIKESLRLIKDCISHFNIEYTNLCMNQASAEDLGRHATKLRLKVQVWEKTLKVFELEKNLGKLESVTCCFG